MGKINIPSDAKLYQSILLYLEGRTYAISNQMYNYYDILKDGVCQIKYIEDGNSNLTQTLAISLKITLPLDIFKKYSRLFVEIRKKIEDVGNFLLKGEDCNCNITSVSISPIVDLGINDSKIVQQLPEKKGSLLSENLFLKHLVDVLKGDFLLLSRFDGLIPLLSKSNCEYTFLKSEDAKEYFDIDFYFSPVDFGVINNAYYVLNGLKPELLTRCNSIYPPNKNVIFKSVNFYPKIEFSNEDGLKAISDLIKKRDLKGVSLDIQESAKKMSEAYMLLYCLENTIRELIDRRFIEHYGVNYWKEKIETPKLKDSITKRINNESCNKWLTQRGEKELYYLDFDDLANLIINHWICFKKDFSGQNWIKQKIEELYGIRCLIAHNSLNINEDNLKLLHIYFNQIISQIG